MPASEMQFIVAKGEKRLRDDGKETVFFRNEVEITSKKVKGFKKRKIGNGVERASPVPCELLGFPPFMEEGVCSF